MCLKRYMQSLVSMSCRCVHRLVFTNIFQCKKATFAFNLNPFNFITRFTFIERWSQCFLAHLFIVLDRGVPSARCLRFKVASSASRSLILRDKQTHLLFSMLYDLTTTFRVFELPFTHCSRYRATHSNARLLSIRLADCSH